MDEGDELLEDSEVLFVMPYDENSHPLTDERRHQQRLELTAEPEPAEDGSPEAERRGRGERRAGTRQLSAGERSDRTRAARDVDGDPADRDSEIAIPRIGS